jgi:hypothetical protein
MSSVTNRLLLFRSTITYEAWNGIFCTPLLTNWYGEQMSKQLTSQLPDLFTLEHSAGTITGEENEHWWNCANFNEIYKERILILHTVNWNVPQMILNRHYSNTLLPLYENGEIASPLVRAFFSPHNDILKDVFKFKRAHFSSVTMGVQIRVHEHIDEKKHIRDLITCINTHYPELEKNNIRIITIGMYSWYHQYFYETSKISVRYSLAPESEQRSYEHMRGVLFDILLLSLTNILITSPWSSFGYLSIAYGRKTPLQLFGFQKAGPQPKCMQLATIEPCRLDMKDGKSTYFQDFKCDSNNEPTFRLPERIARNARQSC